MALNYLQRMSGIATYTRSVAAAAWQEQKTKLLDTRKTTPNMRIFEKYAVRVGGGYNHRYNLSDGVLLKDNHIGAAGSVTKAVKMAQESCAIFTSFRHAACRPDMVVLEQHTVRQIITVVVSSAYTDRIFLKNSHIRRCLSRVQQLRLCSCQAARATERV